MYAQVSPALGRGSAPRRVAWFSPLASRRGEKKERTMYEFKFHRPTTVRQAAGLLARQEEAKLLAGGHTLIPTMKLRLAGPKHIIDMSKIEGLSSIEMKGR